MALGELRLGIPGTSHFSAFATSALPAVTLSRAPAGTPLALRSELGFAELAGRSNWGTAAIAGPAHTPKYTWAVAALVTLDEALQLGALAKWQDAAYKAKADGALRLIDETELLDPEPNPHSRVLLSVLTPTWASGYRYGYGIFPVLVQLPSDWKTQVGRWSTGDDARLVTFSLLEI